MPSSLKGQPQEMHSGIPPQVRRSGVRIFLLWTQPLAIVATLLLLSLKPPGDLGVPSIPHIDKVIHFMVYGLIATGFYRAARPLFSASSAVWIAVLLTSFFGGLDEIWQSFHPGRTPEWGDWIADTAGAILAVYLYRHWTLYRKILEWPHGKCTDPNK